jgi:hypothetical protein
VGRHGGAQHGVTTLDEAGDPVLEGRALQDDVTAAGLAPESDVRAEAVDQPRLTTAGVAAPETDDIAEEELDDR